jgi:hypothetical protein
MKFTATRLRLAASCVVSNARRATQHVCALRLACRAAAQSLSSDFTDSTYPSFGDGICPG